MNNFHIESIDSASNLLIRCQNFIFLVRNLGGIIWQDQPPESDRQESQISRESFTWNPDMFGVLSKYKLFLLAFIVHARTIVYKHFAKSLRIRPQNGFVILSMEYIESLLHRWRNVRKHQHDEDIKSQ
jgi:hypothetical protein